MRNTAAVKRFALVAALMVAAPAWAQGDDEPRFCPNRPSLGSSACTTEPGRVQFEYSIADWQRQDDGSTRDDQVIAGDLLARFGIGAKTEVQVGWTAFGHVRDRDKATGRIDSINGVGDVTLALRQNIVHPDAKGFSIGVQPFVTLPTGRTPIGAGDYAFGVLVPVGYDLSDKLNLQFTGEVDDAADEARDGHHFEASGIIGLSYELSDHWTATGEFSLARIEDPDGKATEALAAGSVAWKPTGKTQFDLLAVAGLNHDSPDVRLVVGGALLF